MTSKFKTPHWRIRRGKVGRRATVASDGAFEQRIAESEAMVDRVKRESEAMMPEQRAELVRRAMQDLYA